MTCVVGVVDEGRVILGADSAGSGEDNEIYSISERKVFARGPYLFGITGSYRLGELLHLKAALPDLPDDHDLKPFLVHEFIPAVADTVRKDHLAREGPEILGPKTGFLLGIRGSLWCVTSDLTVFRAGSFASIGSGRLRAYPVLHALEAAGVKPAKRRLELALDATYAYTSDVRRPWQFVESDRT